MVSKKARNGEFSFCEVFSAAHLDALSARSGRASVLLAGDAVLVAVESAVLEVQPGAAPEVRDRIADARR